MEATVVLDIFSGRPNPEWALTSGTASQICVLLQSLPPAESQPPEMLPGLGYRGFLVHIPDCRGMEKPVRIFQNTAQSGELMLRDIDGKIEKLLLKSAGDAIDQDLREILQEILR